MNLSQCLLYRDIVDLSAMASLYDCSCNRNSKLELVQALHYYMMNKDNYRDLLPNLDQDFLYFTTYILFQPVRYYTINELIVKGDLLAEMILDEALEKFQKDKLYKEINLSLEEKDKEKFMELSLRWARLHNEE